MAHLPGAAKIRNESRGRLLAMLIWPNITVIFDVSAADRHLVACPPTPTCLPDELHSRTGHVCMGWQGWVTSRNRIEHAYYPVERSEP
jgi:hypothetical protein